jgi:hypothetical protein
VKDKQIALYVYSNKLLYVHGLLGNTI